MLHSICEASLIINGRILLSSTPLVDANGNAYSIQTPVESGLNYANWDTLFNSNTPMLVDLIDPNTYVFAACFDNQSPAKSNSNVLDLANAINTINTELAIQARFMAVYVNLAGNESNYLSQMYTKFNAQVGASGWNIKSGAKVVVIGIGASQGGALASAFLRITAQFGAGYANFMYVNGGSIINTGNTGPIINPETIPTALLVLDTVLPIVVNNSQFNFLPPDTLTAALQFVALYENRDAFSKWTPLIPVDNTRCFLTLTCPGSKVDCVGGNAINGQKIMVFDQSLLWLNSLLSYHVIPYLNMTTDTSSLVIYNSNTSIGWQNGTDWMYSVRREIFAGGNVSQMQMLLNANGDTANNIKPLSFSVSSKLVYRYAMNVMMSDDTNNNANVTENKTRNRRGDPNWWPELADFDKWTKELGNKAKAIKGVITSTIQDTFVDWGFDYIKKDILGGDPEKKITNPTIEYKEIQNDQKKITYFGYGVMGATAVCALVPACWPAEPFLIDLSIATGLVGVMANVNEVNYIQANKRELTTTKTITGKQTTTLNLDTISYGKPCTGIPCKGAVGITVDPNPKPKENTLSTEEIYNGVSEGYCDKTGTSRVKFNHDELSSTQFTYSQQASLATGSVRTGSIQLVENAKPADYFGDFIDRRATSVLNGIALGTFASSGTQQQYVDPIVLDLNGNGVQLTSYQSNPVLFDIDNSGMVSRTGWLSPQDGFLARDVNGDKIIRFLIKKRVTILSRLSVQ
jgi:hypothetical protein